MILSASRRTDIPAFYGQWFIERLRAGEVSVRNPMNPRQVSNIALDPDSAECVVFWTKNPAGFMRYLPEIDSLGYRYYFQFTLTPYGSDIEKNIDKSRITQTFIELSEKIGREKVIWRYDPVIVNPEYTIGFHKERFAQMAERLHAYTEKCVISFIDEYAFLKNMFNVHHINELTADQMNEIAGSFSETAAGYSLRLATCCEKIDLSRFNIEKNKCIDGELITRISGKAVQYKKDPSQRAGCGCIASRDIGTYGTCSHECVYCYASKTSFFSARQSR